MKTNLQKISKQISENYVEKDNPFRVTDMVRATVIVNEPRQILLAYH